MTTHTGPQEGAYAMTTLANMPTTWADFDRVVGASASTIANNTVAVRHDDGVAPVHFSVYLHGREIAIVAPSRVYIRDCGWCTRTTYDRLQRLVAPLGARVRRSKGLGILTKGDGNPIAIGDGYWTEVSA